MMPDRLELLKQEGVGHTAGTGLCRALLRYRATLAREEREGGLSLRYSKQGSE